MTRYFILFGLVTGLLACDQKGSIESTKERAKAEEEANRDVENKNLAEKAQKMEADLALRHYYYSAIEGEYQGTVRIGTESYNLKMTLSRSIPPYIGSRVRELGEIEADLNNLYFNIQAVQWHPSGEETSVGCPSTGIRPNMNDGTLFAFSNDCQSLYTVMLSPTANQTAKTRNEQAKALAAKIQKMSLSEVEFLVGTIQPSSIALKYNFSVKKVK